MHNHQYGGPPPAPAPLDYHSRRRYPSSQEVSGEDILILQKKQEKISFSSRRSRRRYPSPPEEAGEDILVLQIEERGQEKEEAEHKKGQDRKEGSGHQIQ